MEITNVNLRFVRKAKGVAPLAPFALQNDGVFVAAVPDPHEVRTFHIARYEASGRFRVRETFSVETLTKTLLAEGDGTGYIGITGDDLYVFQNGRKGRFLPDRRANYADAALSADGKRFGAAFSDMLGAGYSVALGEAPSGRLLWAKDVPFAAACVAISPGGDFLAACGNTGEFWLLDSSRTVVCRFSDTAQIPVLCAAATGDGGTFLGTKSGVSKIRGSARIWHALDGSACPHIAASDGGALIAVVRQSEESETAAQLVFLDGETGVPLWDTDLEESPVTGVSLSPSGAFCAVSLRNGSLFLYETETEARGRSVGDAQIAGEVRALQAAEKWPEAFVLVRTRLEAVPSDTESGELLKELLGAWSAACFSRAAEAEATGDFAEADAAYAACLACDPQNAEAVLRRRSTQRRWAKTRKTEGVAALQESDANAAMTFLRESLQADETQTEVRGLLKAAETAASKTVLQTVQTHLSRAETADALFLLSDLKERGITTPEVAALLRQCRTAEAFALGNSLYNDRQYPAALFQFKKVLRFNPSHRDALQKIAYIQNFLSDTEVGDRFGRLE